MISLDGCFAPEYRSLHDFGDWTKEDIAQVTAARQFYKPFDDVTPNRKRYTHGTMDIPNDIQELVKKMLED